MFKLLKEKISKAVKSITEKLEKKEEIVTEEKKEERKMEAAVKEAIEQPVVVEPVVVEQPKPELPAELPKEEPVATVIERVEQPIAEREIAEREEVAEVREEMQPKIPVVEEVKEKITEKKKGFFKRIVERVVRPVVKKVTVKRLSEEDVMPILNEMATGMIEADVAYDVAEKIKGDLVKSLVNQEIKRGTERQVIISTLENSLLEILHVPGIDLTLLAKQKTSGQPVVVLFLGFNGSGKTTSLAKVGKWLIDRGYSVVFAAADTFRAAAEEQIEEHAVKVGVKVIKHKYGADPAAVIFDAIEHAKANGIKFVLADTAGRTHVNRNLMDEMKKIIRVNKPDLKILVIDSLTGNDAVLQARMFNEVGVDGLIFTKVDVNEKGGAILSVTHELKKPILFLGMGQSYADFKRFDAREFVNMLLS